ILHEMPVEISRVGAERAHLTLGGFDHARMAMADVRHVVVAVDVASAGLVKEVLHRAADDLHGPPVADPHVAANRAPARGENVGVAHRAHAIRRQRFSKRCRLTTAESTQRTQRTQRKRCTRLAFGSLVSFVFTQPPYRGTEAALP